MYRNVKYKIVHAAPTEPNLSSRSAYRQFPHLLQHGFDLSIQLTGGVILPDRIAEVILNIAKLFVSLLSELALYTNHGFERRIEVGNAQAEELGKFRDELVVEEVKDFFGFVVLLLGPWEFSRVVTRLCKRFVQLAAGGVVVKQLNEQAISSGSGRKVGV